MAERRTIWLEIEEIHLDVPAGTDWAEVQRTRVPPRRLPPREEWAVKGLALLEALGWSDLRILAQGWDDHPQSGKVWSTSVEGVPPPGWAGNWTFWNPHESVPCGARLHPACDDPGCRCRCHAPPAAPAPGA